MVINMIIAFTLSAVMAAIFTPLTIKLAKKIGIMDIPNDARKIQKEPMPRLGGLEKECVSGDEEDPCAVFEKMAFPVNEFSPPPYR